jgi:Reverse transcriptase (RNA-dependent DNA polymerase)
LAQQRDGGAPRVELCVEDEKAVDGAGLPVDHLGARAFQREGVVFDAARISDQAVLKLLRAMLRAGVMQDGQVMREAMGAAQGGVISPLLCNVYLHRIDRVWDRREHGVLVRFADDVLVMCKSREQAEAALQRLRDLLAELGLEPKEAKTRIVHLGAGGVAWISSAFTIGW